MEAVELFPQVDDAEASVTKLSAGSLALPTTLASMRTVRGPAALMRWTAMELVIQWQ